MDILKVALDFAEHRPLDIPELSLQRCCVGLRLHADRAGSIRQISTARLEKDGRVKTIHLIRKGGHQVTLPPEDYDSWYLGHLIFVPEAGRDVEEQCLELRQLLTLEIEGDS